MVNISVSELTEILEITPAEQNIMLVGKHGIGKSEILTDFFYAKGIRVVTLFLGQMSDPGDIIGLPLKDEATGRTLFLPPYWFPTDDKPIVLFLDELNRARPEVLQTIMDLALNRKLAGRSLPIGSRLISAVNDGEEYQLTDLDPALVSRFNVYAFSPTVVEWTEWANRQKIDSRVVDFIVAYPEWLDGGHEKVQIDTGLEKLPDRRAWVKVAKIVERMQEVGPLSIKILSGVVGVSAATKFVQFISSNNLLTGREVLTAFDACKARLSKYKTHELAAVNDSVLRYLDTCSSMSEADIDVLKNNLVAYFNFLKKGKSKESVAHFASIVRQGNYSQAYSFIFLNVPEVYRGLIEYVSEI